MKAKIKKKFLVKWDQPSIEPRRVKKPFVFRQLHYHGLSVLGQKLNKIVIIGGLTPSRHADVFVYNVDSGHVRYVTRMKGLAETLPGGISGHKICALDQSRVLVGTGEVGDRQFNGEFHLVDLKKRLWTKQETKGTWEIPKNLEGYSWNKIGDFLYMFGGGGKIDYTNFVHILNLKTFTWEKVSPKAERGSKLDIPPPMFFHSTVVIGSDIYVFGGAINSRANNLLSKSDVYIFSTVKKTWLKKIPINMRPCGFSGGCTVLYDSKYVVLCGGETKDVTMFDVEEKEFVEVKTEGVPPAQFDCGAMVVVKGRIFCVGGNQNAQKTVNYGIYELVVKEEKEEELLQEGKEKEEKKTEVPEKKEEEKGKEEDKSKNTESEKEKTPQLKEKGNLVNVKMMKVQEKMSELKNKLNSLRSHVDGSTKT